MNSKIAYKKWLYNDKLSIILSSVSIIALILNILYFSSIILGVTFSIIYLFALSKLLKKSIKVPMAGALILSFICIFTLISLVNIFFFYFFALNIIAIIFSLIFCFVCIVLYYFYKKNKTFMPGSDYKLFPTVSHSFFNKKLIWLVPLNIGLIISMVVFLFKLRGYGHIYQGTIPLYCPFFILGLVFFSIFIMVFSKIKTVYPLVLIIFLFIAISSIYVINLDNIYGADGWRHLGNEIRSASGYKYEPTKISELIKFKSAKIPNASLYTLIPTLHHLTQIDVPLIHKYFTIFLLGPLLILIVYLAGKDIFHDRKIAFILVMSGFLAGGFMGIQGYTNVQQIGLFYFIVNLWIWIRYILNKDQQLKLYHYVISLFAILAYPTLGYYSLVVIILALFIRFLEKLRHKISPIYYIIPMGIFFSLPILLLDIFLIKASVKAEYKANWLSFFQIIKDWFKGIISLNINNLGLLFFGIIIIALIWLYKKERFRIFVLLSVMLLTLQFNLWFRSIFDVKVVPLFSNRIGSTLSTIYAILFFIGFVIILQKFIKAKYIFGILAIGLLFSHFFINANNINNTVFGWSISNKEVEAINYIKDQNKNTKYIVLTDETTSAAGYALTDNEYSYYWYPVTTTYNLYRKVVKNPTLDHFNSACALDENLNNIYFLFTKIPPTSGKKKIKERLEAILPSPQKINDDTFIFIYPCPKMKSSN